MKPVEVSKVKINKAGELLVRPSMNPDKICRFVYRAAMEVDWSEEEQSFICPVPRDWTHFDWYKQVVSAVVSELGILPQITDKTSWENVSAALQEAISSYVYEKST
ncbi:MAG: hypothetical protein KF888_10565 [Nitrosomonas sp.]|nr:hypothetical protein [Nitrosomonas sp.]